MAQKEIILSGKPITVHKAIGNPDFSSKTVLVTDAWDYLVMWLKRIPESKLEDKRKLDALFYWNQARDFFQASLSLPNTSAPLTSYYCFLNAVKTLLSVKNINITESHGVNGKTTSNRAELNNEEISFFPKGVLSGLCQCLNETSNHDKYVLKDLLYNLPYIHRAYNLTFPSQPELFIPITNPKFVKEKGSNEAWFCTEITDKKYKNQHTINKLPLGYEQDPRITENFIIRKKESFEWQHGCKHKDKRIESLTKYHALVRKHVFYIHGPSRLWYIKRGDSPNIIDRSSLTITFAAMHRLSELARYNPLLLSHHFDTQHNWLLYEFLSTAIHQFVDEISSEITGHEFMVPGKRGIS